MQGVKHNTEEEERVAARRESRQGYKRRHPERDKESRKRWREKHRAEILEKKRQARYGLSPEAYAQLWKSQGGLCAICLTVPPEHVDHDHATGEIRGLLCQRCNMALGLFKDDTEILERAIFYLR